MLRERKRARHSKILRVGLHGGIVERVPGCENYRSKLFLVGSRTCLRPIKK